MQSCSMFEHIQNLIKHKLCMDWSQDYMSNRANGCKERALLKDKHSATRQPLPSSIRSDHLNKPEVHNAHALYETKSERPIQHKLANEIMHQPTTRVVSSVKLYSGTSRL